LYPVLCGFVSKIKAVKMNVQPQAFSNLRKSFIFFSMLCIFSGLSLAAQEPKSNNAGLLPESSRLAILGDSITKQKIYSKYVETYLLACAGRKDISVFQFGWSGETAAGFLNRMEKDLSVFKPTAATICYGMNDGKYRPYEDEIGKSYDKSMRAVMEKLKGMGVTCIVIGTPGAVDTKFFKFKNADAGGKSAAESYNESLKRLRDFDEKIASELKLPFADLHSVLIDTMSKAKKAKGDDYDVCGRDGVHPAPDGHLIMAYAFLKALGCDGNIGKITVDMKGSANATEGHKVVSASDGKIEIESTRYPFCFDADPDKSSSNRSILPYFPFNQDLNKFLLIVKNLGSAKAKVSWGGETKEFTREQLEAGINLAAEFAKTPFDGNFMKVSQAVLEKQTLEMKMQQGVISQYRNTAKFSDDELKKAAETLKQMMDERAKLEVDAKAAIVPVKHSITIAPIP